MISVLLNLQWKAIGWCSLIDKKKKVCILVYFIFQHVSDVYHAKIMRRTFCTTPKEPFTSACPTRNVQRIPSPDALGCPCELKARWKRKTRRCEISILGLGDWWVQRRFAQCHISILQTPVTSRCHTKLQRVSARRGGQCVGSETSTTEI